MTFRAPRHRLQLPDGPAQQARGTKHEKPGGASLDALRRRYEFDAGLDCAEISRPDQRPGRLKNPPGDYSGLKQ
jgi:hypothetical protein